MLEKECERVGIPAVLITALIPTAKIIGANRMVQGIAITHPLGDPGISGGEEKSLRKEIVESALALLTQDMQGGNKIDVNIDKAG